MKFQTIFLAFLCCLLIQTRIKAQEEKVSELPNFSTTVKLSVLQLSGFRLPIVIEQTYFKRFSTSIGVGPTLGKRLLGGFHIFSSYDYGRIENRKIGHHLQAEQRVYINTKGEYLHYLSVFGRYGYFPTQIMGQKTYLEKQQLYFAYGYKEKVGKCWLEWLFGLGFSKVEFRGYKIPKYIEEEPQEHGFYVEKHVLPAFVLGVNIGFDLY